MSAYIRKTDGGIYVRFRSPSFGPQETITRWLTKTEIFTLHWINIITRNNKCIFTKLNAIFKLKTVVWTKKTSTPTTQFVQRVQLSSEETVQWHKLWQLPDTNLPRQLQYTCFIKGKTSYGRHYHKFCSWRATISTFEVTGTHQVFAYC